MDNPVYKLLIVEDDLGIAQAIQTQASIWNFDVRIVENFRDVTGEVTSFSPHIILLDITLPFFNGYHWCSEIRKFSRVPIILIFILSFALSFGKNLARTLKICYDDTTQSGKKNDKC